MKQSFRAVMLAVALVSCRAYDLESRLTDQGGLIPPDQFARYGREQAQEIAIAREYGQASGGSTPEHVTKRADAAVRYAQTMPDVTNVGADPLGLRLTIRLKSGWLTMVTPIEDGKRGAETGGLPAESGAGSGR